MNVIPYARKSKRARSSSTAGRRGSRSKAKSSIPRTLSAINKQVVSTVMGSSWNVPINNTTGFSAAGLALQIVADQNGVLYNIGTGTFLVAGGAVFPNAASFATIYDEYRITKMEFEFLYSNNTSAIAGTNALPILYVVRDYDDVTPLTSDIQALGYATCKTIQLGNSSGGSGGKQFFKVDKPAVRISVDTVNNVVGTVGSGMLTHSPWLNTDNANIEHNGLKMYLDTVVANNTNVGVLTITCRVFQQYRFSK